MISCLALISALICSADLASALTDANGQIISNQGQQGIKHIVLNDANLISSAQGYALNHRDLLTRLNVKTVSVNGDKVEIYDSQCQLTTITQSQLSMMNDKQEVINSVVRSLQGVESGANSMNGQAMRSGVTHYSMNGNSISSTGNRNMKSSNFNSNGISVVKFDDNNMSIGKPNGGLPNNINRLFINNDVVTYVYHDGHLLMKPAACMSQQEQQLVQQLRLEVQESKRKFDLQMQQFQQNMQMNMQNMHRNMQQSMGNMQQSMQNMFPPGFPFHNQPMMNQMGGQNGMRQNSGYGFGGSPTVPRNPNAFAGNYGQAGYGGNYGGLDGAYAGGYGGYGGNGASAYSQSNGAYAAAGGMGANWPFGSNNNPFGGNFPFNR